MTQKPNSSPFSGKLPPFHIQTVRQVSVNIKGMLMILFDYDVTVHQQLNATGQMVNHHYYWEVLQCLTKQAC